MHNFDVLAAEAWAEYQQQPGILSVVADGEPAGGLRYKFDNNATAERFIALRQLHNSYEPANANLLKIEDAEVVEIWRL